MAITDVIKRLIYQFTSTGAEKVADDIGKVNTEQTKLAASTPQVTKASLDLSKSFENLERRFDSTIRAQQDYQKVQDKVNAAVAQNPALQERANSVLAKAAEHFDRAGKATTAYAGAVDAARGAALGLAADIGPLGAVLGSLGPWGIAAAAGIGLVTKAFTYFSEGAAKAGDASIQLQKMSEIAGLTTRQIIGLTEAGSDLGIAEDKIATAIQKFTVNLDAAREGSGALYEKLTAIDRRLAEQVASAGNTAAAIDILAQAYNSTTDATTKAALAVAAFGKGGVEVGRILGEIGGGLDKYSSGAEKALGVSAQFTDKTAKLRIEVKDLEGDLERLNQSFYAEEILTRQKQALKTQIELTKAAKEWRDATAPGDEYYAAGVQQVADAFGIAKPAMEELTKAKKEDTEATEAGTAATYKGTSALSFNTEAINTNADALARKAAQSAKDVAALGTAATLAEKAQARIDALNASFAKGEISANILGRAIEGVHNDTEKAEKSMKLAANTTAEMGNNMARSAGQAKSLAAAMLEVGYAARNIDEATYLYDASGAGSYPAGSNADYFSSPGEMGKSGRIEISNDPRVISAHTPRGLGGNASRGNISEYGLAAFEDEMIGEALASRAAAAQAGLDASKAALAEMVAANAANAENLTVAGKKEFDDFLAKQGIYLDDMQRTIDNLTKSTDALNATNQEMLSPYYTMDPRTSHIGFRSQGMASGGYVDVPGGVSSNDNMMAMIPVASGERIYVDPMTNRRGTASGGMTINISSPITINGNANADQFGRTLYQSNQNLAKQIRASTQ